MTALPTPEQVAEDVAKRLDKLIGVRERWVLLGVQDLDAVPLAYWRDPDVTEALYKVLQRAVRGGVREIPGCSIGVEGSVAVRVG